MSRRNTRPQSENGGKVGRFFASKGYYLVLVVGAILVCVAAFAAARNSVALPEDINLDFGDIDTMQKPTDGTEPDTNVLNPSTDVTESTNREEDEEPSPEGDDVTVVAQSKPETQKEEAPKSFLKPVDGKIMGEFSNGENVYSVTMNDYRVHDGTDIEAETGSEIRAAADGVISGLYYDDMWGQVIVITHPGDYKTVYKCLGENLPSTIHPNAKVSRGQVIGYVGDNLIESALKSHLHFEISKSGKLLDATTFFS